MLTIANLTLGYNAKAVAKLPKLTVPKGGQCLITGASGSGKTTLLFAIAGLVPVLEGSIKINDVDITQLSETARDHFRSSYFGIIFQTLHLVRSLSVIDNLMLSSYAAGISQNKDHAMRVLKQLGIEDKCNAMPSSLSQGQAQRVAIARAVLHRPAMILADEPTSSLDDESCTKVISLIKEAAEETGATLLISTHDSRIKPYFAKTFHLQGCA